MDKLNAMAVFVRVVESGSFTAVARELNTTQPTISKLIRALEVQLGGKLIARSTRQLSLTDEGRRYYSECRQILAAVDAAEHSFKSGREIIAGPLRVASSVSFGRLQVAPRLGRFLERHPQVRIDLRLSDRHEDLLAEGVDVAIRIGEPRDSNLIARHLGLTRRLTVAAPAYLARHGEPTTPEQLVDHNCLVFSELPEPRRWRYRRGARWQAIDVDGNLSSNSSEAIRELVLAGSGIALSPLWLFAEDLRAGRVRALLADYVCEALPIQALLPANRRQSARVRAFLDYLAAELAVALPG